MTRGSFCTTSIEPSASTLPSCSTVTLRAICETNSMSCSTTTHSLVDFHRQFEILEYRMGFEDSRLLEFAADADVRDFGFGEA